MKLKKIISNLSLKEKVSLLSGFDNWYTPELKKYGIPKIKMSDGPNGVRGDSNTPQTSACFPSCLLYTSPSPRDKRQSRMPSSA